MSKLPKIILIILFITLTLAGGCKEELKNNEKINIAVTLAPYADLVKIIVKDFAKVNTLIPPGVNAHAFELTPETMKNIINAEIYFSIGPISNFEKIVLNKINAEKKLVIDCSKNITIKNNNPHYWLSIKNAKIIATNISEALSLKYPQHKGFFQKNKNQLVAQLDSMDLRIQSIIEQKKNKALFVFHPAWFYFTEDYGLEEISIEQDGKEPKAKELKKIIQIAKNKGVSCIFFDPHFDDSTVETIAKSLGLNIDSLDPLPSNYLQNLKDIEEKISRHLK